MTDDLVAWLTEQLDHDQRIAESTRQASPSWQNFDMDGELRDDVNAGTVCIAGDADRAHIALHDPARVLREIAAKKAIIKAHGPHLLYHQVVKDYDGSQRLGTLVRCRSCEPPQEITRDTWPCPTLRHMAAVYADRPGYDESWRP
ncbi:DUF6221 family protein [Streptodolium elevatio]|uniref:DUF6221 family protein n=1 Tax=Streptodolium elevatio TaxID=3157996 RepID=A0ABV3DKX0_9ACTN